MTSKSGPGRLNEKAFAKLIQERLLTTDQVRELLGLETIMGVQNRVRLGHLTGPIRVQDKAFSLWDRVQVEREEARRIEAALASGDGRSMRTLRA